MTYKGDPVPGALVTFVYQDGNVASANTDAQGKFAMDAPAGTAKVAVTKPSANAGAAYDIQNMTPTEAMAKMQGQGKKKTTKPKDELPAKYGNPETSGFVADVKPGGTNDFTFALTD